MAGEIEMNQLVAAINSIHTVIDRIGLDVMVMKTVLVNRGLITAQEWNEAASAIIDEAKKRAAEPQIVKPNSGIIIPK